MKSLSFQDLKKTLSSISPSTRTLALIFLPPLPIIAILLQFFSQLNHYEIIESEIDRIQQKSRHFEQLNKKEHAIVSSLQNSDHFYIDNHLESLCFLETETRKTKTLLAENPLDEKGKKRLSFLKDGGNRLLFSETKTRSKGTFSEVEEEQQHPVEMDEEDLKKLLSLVEGVTIWPYGPREKRPQLIIKDFDLSKKENISQDCVFVINMNIIKRESKK